MKTDNTESKQLNRLHLLPANVQAARLLRMVGSPPDPGYPANQPPALIQLLMWAVENPHGLDRDQAEAVLQDLMHLGMVRGQWEKAVGVLLDADNNPPQLMEAKTTKEACAAILNLARMAVASP